jgi:hypothetical protein
VELAHLKKSVKRWSKCHTRASKFTSWGALSPAWTELVVCDVLPRLQSRRRRQSQLCRVFQAVFASHPAAPPPPAPAAAPAQYAAITTAERRAQLAALTAAMEGGGGRELKAMAFFVCV